MSLENTDRVDAVTIQNGWATLLFTHFAPWEAEDDLLEALRHKLEAAQHLLRDTRTRSRLHLIPTRIALHCTHAPPATIAAFCAAHHIHILGPGDPDAPGD